MIRWGGFRGEPDPGATVRRLVSITVVAVLVLVGVLLRGPLGRWLRPPKSCGWTVQGEVVLERDVTGCAHHGVRLAPFSVLDCAGHEIRGTDDESSGYGVRMDQVEQAEVRNCRISGFSRGIRIRGGRDNRVIENEVVANGYGIEVAGGTDGVRTEGHRIARNRISESRRDGIHLGGGTAQIRVEDNHIEKSGEEGLTLERSEGVLVSGNTIEESASGAIDLKDSRGGRFERNAVRGSLVKIRGSSSRNVFGENELVRSGYVLSATRPDGEAHAIPAKNRIVGGSVLDSQVCFRFNGAVDNVVEDVRVDDCRVREDRTVDGAEPVGNEVVVVR